MVVGPYYVTENAEGTTHNEMQAPCPPAGMETTERMNYSGQDCGDKTFRDTPPRSSQVSTSVLSAAEMKKIREEKKALPPPIPVYPKVRSWGRSCTWVWGDGRGERTRPVGVPTLWFHQHKGSRKPTPLLEGSEGTRRPWAGTGWDSSTYSNVYPASGKPRVWD